MLIDIIKAISIKLNTVFGDSYEIYTENVKQGLKEPCFFIKPLPTASRTLIGKRSQRTYSFIVSYFPKVGNAEMMEVSDKLIDELEYITLINGDMLRGSAMSPEIVDEVLHFSVNYNVIVNDFETEEEMESMSHVVGTKGV